MDNSQFDMSNPLSFNADVEAPPAKRRRWGEFELQDKPVPDFVTRGLITVEQAQSYFDSFVPFLPLSGLFMWLLANFYSRSASFVDVYVYNFVNPLVHTLQSKLSVV